MGLKTQNSTKKCISSLTPLPPRDFTVFEQQFLLEYYTQRAKNVIMY